MAEGGFSDDTKEREKMHAIFSTEVMHFLKNQAGLKVEYVSEYEYLTADIGEAILTLSTIFHSDFRKIFKLLRRSLKNTERYKEYCEIIPLSKDSCYFYHYLKRLSLIYVLALYGYNSNHNKGYKYFDFGRSCIEKCPDMEFFECMGGWTNLQRAASFLAEIGRPLKFITLKEYVKDEKIRDFNAAVKNVYRNFVLTGDIKMVDSKEMECLRELKEIFRAKVDNELLKRTLDWKASDASQDDMFFIMDAYHESRQEEVLMKYFEDCLDKTLCENISTKKATESSSIQQYSVKEKRLSGVLESESAQHVDPKNSCIPQEHPTGVRMEGTKVSSLNDTLGKSRIRTKVNEQTNQEKLKNVTAESRNMFATSSEESDDLQEDHLGIKIKNEPADAFESGEGEILNLFFKEGSDIKPNFVIPKTYLKCREKKDKFKHFHCAKMFPPSKRTELGTSLKQALDANIVPQKCKPMASGDIFVSVSSGSSPKKEDAIVVFVDSSSDGEIDEDTYELLCHFKNNDIDNEAKSYNLRRKKLVFDEDELKSTSSDSESEDSNADATSEFKVSTIHVARKLPGYVEYLVKLYKKCLPRIINKSFERILSKSEKSVENQPTTPSSLAIPRKESSFIMTARMLAKRKVELEESEEHENILMIQMRDSVLLGIDHDLVPINMPLSEQHILNSHILSKLYCPITADNSVYRVGEDFSDDDDFFHRSCWLLFSPPAIGETYAGDHRREVDGILCRYFEALVCHPQLPEVLRSTLRHFCHFFTL